MQHASNPWAPLRHVPAHRDRCRDDHDHKKEDQDDAEDASEEEEAGEVFTQVQEDLQRAQGQSQAPDQCRTEELHVNGEGTTGEVLGLGTDFFKTVTEATEKLEKDAGL